VSADEVKGIVRKSVMMRVVRMPLCLMGGSPFLLYETFREVMLFTEGVGVFGMICSCFFGEVVALLLDVGLCIAHTKYMTNDIKEIVDEVVVIRTQMNRCIVSFSIRPGRTDRANMFERSYIGYEKGINAIISVACMV